jgi:uncharacterized protein
MHLQKLERLSSILNELGSVLVAFSSGTDSALLLKVAHETLGENAMAATISSAALPESELNEAVEFCKRLGVRHEIVKVDIEKIAEFTEYIEKINPEELIKKEIERQVKARLDKLWRNP